MQLPDYLQAQIEKMVEHTSHKALKEARETLSFLYKEKKGSFSIFENEALRLVYLAARFPATYAAVSKICQGLIGQISPKSLLDLGAGPATASLAALEQFTELETITLIEQSTEAIQLGKKLGENIPILEKGHWIQASLPTALPGADLAILSYALMELQNPFLLLEQWWESKTPFLIILEPGTPSAYAFLMQVRQKLCSLGAFVIAPCPHQLPCGMKPPDWCHFSVRLERSRLHRFLKGADLGYEDEKYCYLVMSREPVDLSLSSRIVSRPKIHKGFVELNLCGPSGQVTQSTFSKSQKQIYRKARKSEWGDSIDQPFSVS